MRQLKKYIRRAVKQIGGCVRDRVSLAVWEVSYMLHDAQQWPQDYPLKLNWLLVPGVFLASLVGFYDLEFEVMGRIIDPVKRALKYTRQYAEWYGLDGVYRLALVAVFLAAIAGKELR